MSTATAHTCECADFRRHGPLPERVVHQRINLVVRRLNEQQRRWFVALEAERRGHGGTEQVVAITDLRPHTIRKGRRELARGYRGCPTDRLGAPGAGRPAREAQAPATVPPLAQVLAEVTAGAPNDRATGRTSATARSRVTG